MRNSEPELAWVLFFVLGGFLAVLLEFLEGIGSFVIRFFETFTKTVEVSSMNSKGTMNHYPTRRKSFAENSFDLALVMITIIFMITINIAYILGWGVIKLVKKAMLLFKDDWFYPIT